MPDIQEQLRRELTAVAERIQPEMLRPLRAPRPRGLLARHGRAVRLMAPVAAAAAVIGVVGSVTVASGPAKRGHVAGGDGRNAGRPPYYVTLFNDLGTVAVHDSATGAVLDSAKLPLHLSNGAHRLVYGGAVSAAGDGRTFAVAVETTQVYTGMDSIFFRLRLGPGGRSVHVTPIKVPSRPWASDPVISLTPDGTKLAIIYGSHVGTAAPVEVVNLVTGVVRTGTWAGPGYVDRLSWADDRDLALDSISVEAAPAGGSAPTGLWLLDTAAAGRDMRAASRLILPTAIRAGHIQDAQILPGGRTAIAVVERSGSKSIVELAAGTGRVVRHLYGPVPAKGLPCGFIGGSFSAGHVLAACPHLGRIDNGRFTQLPKIVAPFGVTAW
jgi:hypothetical protein